MTSTKDIYTDYCKCPSGSMCQMSIAFHQAAAHATKRSNIITVRSSGLLFNYTAYRLDSLRWVCDYSLPSLTFTLVPNH